VSESCSEEAYLVSRELRWVLGELVAIVYAEHGELEALRAPHELLDL